jgi:hypothetical protein
MVELPSWPRRLYAEDGGRPYVYWLVFGHFRPLELHPASYRSHGVPDGVRHERIEREDPNFPAFVLRDTWAEIAWQDYPGLLDAVARAPQVTVLEGAVTSASTLDYLRDLVGVVTCLLDRGGVGVVDVLAHKWWSPEAFRHQLFAPRRPMPFQHVSILASPAPDGTAWMYTRGMRIFGRPDVSVRAVRPEQTEAFVEMFNRFIAASAEGLVVHEGDEVAIEMLPGSWLCHHRGRLDDPMFHNVHLEVVPH